MSTFKPLTTAQVLLFLSTYHQLRFMLEKNNRRRRLTETTITAAEAVKITTAAAGSHTHIYGEGVQGSFFFYNAQRVTRQNHPWL